MPKHTPTKATDEWMVVPDQMGDYDDDTDEDDVTYEVIRNPRYSDGGNLVAYGNICEGVINKEVAYLIAAAPNLLAACRAVLLFHAGGPWDADAEWNGLTGNAPATTKGLCDFIRSVLAKAQGEQQ